MPKLKFLLATAVSSLAVNAVGGNSVERGGDAPGEIDDVGEEAETGGTGGRTPTVGGNTLRS